MPDFAAAARGVGRGDRAVLNAAAAWLSDAELVQLDEVGAARVAAARERLLRGEDAALLVHAADLRRRVARHEIDATRAAASLVRFAAPGAGRAAGGVCVHGNGPECVVCAGLRG